MRDCKVFEFSNSKRSECIVFPPSLCHLLPESPLLHLSVFFFISLFPPSSVRWTVSAGVVSLFCPRAGDVCTARSCFKLSFPEMFEGTSRVLSVPVTLSKGRGRGGRISSYLASHLAINEQTTLSLSRDRRARTGPLPLWLIFFAQDSLMHTYMLNVMCTLCISSIGMSWMFQSRRSSSTL